MNFFGIGLPELIVIAVVLLLFFGKDKLPGLARGIASAVRELRSGISGTGDTHDSGTSEQPKSNQKRNSA